MRKKTGGFAKLMGELCRSKKYIGKYVAVVKDKIIVAVGRNHFEAFKKAKKNHPHEQLGIYYVPTAREALTVLCNIHISK